jgi:hypothetical protein
LFPKAEPGGSRSDPVPVVDDVQQIGGDGVEELGDDDAIHARPGWVGKVWCVGKDMVLQSEATEDEENVAAPLRVVRGLKVQGDRNKIPDVLDGGSLAVEPSNSNGVGGEGVVVVVLELVVARRVFAGLGRAMTIPESSGVLLQVEGQSALMLERIRGDPVRRRPI